MTNLIHDIPTSKLWIPPTLAAGCYLAPFFLSKVFRADDWFKKDPDLKRFVLIDAKDNLPLSVFIMSMAALRDRQFKDPFFFFFSTIFLCRFISGLRKKNSEFFSFIAKKIPETSPSSIIGIACEKVASLTGPSKLPG